MKGFNLLLSFSKRAFPRIHYVYCLYLFVYSHLDLHPCSYLLCPHETMTRYHNLRFYQQDVQQRHCYSRRIFFHQSLLRLVDQINFSLATPTCLNLLVFQLESRISLSYFSSDELKVNWVIFLVINLFGYFGYLQSKSIHYCLYNDNFGV